MIERSFRYERKFLVEELDAPHVKALVLLHPYMFYQPYPPRYINNFYLDTREMENYFENVDGSGDRTKIRIRWYGELFGHISKPVLEYKIKRGLVGTKQQYAFPPINVDDGYSTGYLWNRIAQSTLPDKIKQQIRNLDVVLLNRYFRRYFATRDGRFRVTIDTDLMYYKVNNLCNDFIHRQEDYKNIVVELKYDKELDPEANRVSSYFPFRVTKNSKYVTGIERVFF
jgi:SPX domain protein involved in polyphosphate accumulation